MKLIKITLFLLVSTLSLKAELSPFDLSLREAYEDVPESSIPYEKQAPNFSFYKMLTTMRFTKSGLKQSLDTQRHRLGSFVERSATWADGLFGDIDPQNYENESYITLGTYYDWSDYRDVNRIGLRLKSKLHLPVLQKRFKLIVSSTSESLFREDLTGTDDNFDEIDQQGQTDNTFATAIGWTFKQTKELLLDLKVGLKFDLPLEPYAKTKLIRQFNLGYDWKLNLEQNFFTVINDETGSTTAFTFSKRLSTHRLISSRTYGFISDLEDFQWNHGYSYFQDIGSDRSYSISADISGITEPRFEHDAYRLGAHYRQKFFRPWLYFYLSPALVFPRTEDWEGQPQFRIGIDAIISTRDH